MARSTAALTRDGAVTTPIDEGFSLPAETVEHERCLMAWPTSGRSAYWSGEIDEARAAWAAVALAIARFEPVTVVVDPGDAPSAENLLRDEVELVELPIDDAWMRDNGPIVLTRADGDRLATRFRFNAWGEKWAPFDRDAAVSEPLCEHLGLRRVDAPFVLEGGSVVGNGEGLLVTTERCLLNTNRNPSLTKDDIEALLRQWLGVDRVLWLRDALADDFETDGHVDNVVAFPRPDVALLQGTTDEDDPDHATAADSRHRLVDAGIDVVDIDVLPTTVIADRRVEVPYVNFYVANGGVVVPVTGHGADGEMLDRIASCFPDREVVGVAGGWLAVGGGGVHCITQPVPHANRRAL